MTTLASELVAAPTGVQVQEYREAEATPIWYAAATPVVVVIATHVPPELGSAVVRVYVSALRLSPAQESARPPAWLLTVVAAVTAPVEALCVLFT